MLKKPTIGRKKEVDFFSRLFLAKKTGKRQKHRLLFGGGYVTIKNSDEAQSRILRVKCCSNGELSGKRKALELAV